MSELESVKDEVLVELMGADKYRVRPRDLENTVAKKMGVSPRMARQAVNELVEEDELAYVYEDPCNYVEIAPMTGHHAARPMEVLVDANGEPWICDADVDPSSDLIGQDCWRCGDLPFTRND